MSDQPVIVVGAGLAGLACATELVRAGCRVLLLEASEAVGGRVRTDTVDGFVIDRGFQVLNTGYPALRSLDLAGLDLRRFPQAVRVLHKDHVDVIPSPLTSPVAPLRAAVSDVIGPRAKLGLARYGIGLALASPSALKARPDLQAREAWQQSTSQEAIDRLLVPFMAGVVLDPDLDTSRIFTDLMMRLFVTGRSSVPACGMQALPELLARGLPAGVLRLDAPVRRVAADRVELSDGEQLHGAAVVVATDPWSADDLVPDLPSPPSTLGVTTYYFAAPAWRHIDPALAVDANRSGIANSVVLTATAPEYSADGRALVATSVFHAEGRPVLTADAAEESARRMHEAPDASWRLIATRTIERALPGMPAPLQLRKPTWFPQSGVWVAGDHRDTSSIQGALVSGRRVARSVHRALSEGGKA